VEYEREYILSYLKRAGLGLIGEHSFEMCGGRLAQRLRAVKFFQALRSSLVSFAGAFQGPGMVDY